MDLTVDCTLFSGQTPSASGDSFREWLSTYLCANTPLDLDDHGLVKDFDCNRRIFYKEIFIHLSQSEYERLCHCLMSTFAMLNPQPGTIAAWSRDVEQNGLRLGNVFVLKGGRGRGEAVVDTIPGLQRQGAFRSA